MFMQSPTISDAPANHNITETQYLCITMATVHYYGNSALLWQCQSFSLTIVAVSS